AVGRGPAPATPCGRPRPRSRYALRAAEAPRPLPPPGGQQQVVEQLRRQRRLEDLAVDALKDQVAMKGVLAPDHRHLARIGGCLQRPVEPPKPVRNELFAAYLDLLETGPAGERGELPGSERVDVHQPRERVTVRVVRVPRFDRR